MADAPRFLLLSQDDRSKDALTGFASKFGCLLDTTSEVKPLDSNNAHEILASGYDVVFVDENFGNYHHCLQLLTLGRYMPAMSAVPIVALTESTSSEKLLELYKAGASCCIPKPLHAEQLAGALDLIFGEEESS